MMVNGHSMMVTAYWLQHTALQSLFEHQDGGLRIHKGKADQSKPVLVHPGSTFVDFLLYSFSC